MIQEFVNKFMLAKDEILKQFLEATDTYSYTELVSIVIKSINSEKEYDKPDPEKIHLIDDGDYQGTQLFIIPCCSYQPSTYWAVYVSYGSCSGCDTLAAIQESGDSKETQANDMWTLCLHIAQGLKEI